MGVGWMLERRRQQFRVVEAYLWGLGDIGKDGIVNAHVWLFEILEQDCWFVCLRIEQFLSSQYLFICSLAILIFLIWYV